jgi:hypothetical protein
LFEISLHSGDVAVSIYDYSDHSDEFEIRIASSSGFMVEEVEWINIRQESESGFREFQIAQVRLNYCISWYDFNIDDPRDPILVSSDRGELVKMTHVVMSQQDWSFT